MFAFTILIPILRRINVKNGNNINVTFSKSFQKILYSFCCIYISVFFFLSKNKIGYQMNTKKIPLKYMAVSLLRSSSSGDSKKCLFGMQRWSYQV